MLPPAVWKEWLPETLVPFFLNLVTAYLYVGLISLSRCDGITESHSFATRSCTCRSLTCIWTSIFVRERDLKFLYAVVVVVSKFLCIDRDWKSIDQSDPVIIVNLVVSMIRSE